MDKQVLNDQITGLTASIDGLRAQERLHIKLQTLIEQIEKARVEADGIEINLSAVKEEKTKLKTEKALSLTGTATKLGEEVTKFLPNGTALFVIDEEGLFIGLKHHGDKITPYLSLSGGEKAFFDLALCHALLGKAANKILIGEVAELDEQKLDLFLKTMIEQKPDTQILINTCHKPGEVPDGWRTINL